MFDTTLLESGKTHRLEGRKRSLPLAIGLHAATIAALVGASVWNPGEPPAPPDRDAIFIPVSLGPPPPSGSEGPRHVSRTTTSVRSPAPVPVVARLAPPDPTPATVEAASPPETDGPVIDGPDEGENSGSGTGVPGGTGDRDGSGTGTGSAGAPLVIGGDVRPPLLETRVEPEYPEPMRRARIEGVVILEAVITSSGGVDEVRVLKSAGGALDRAAADAVRRWRYRPATLNGRAVSVYLTVTVTFGLRS